jgi:hypothetical protein
MILRRNLYNVVNTYNATICFIASWDRTGLGSSCTQSGRYHVFFGCNYVIALIDLKYAIILKIAIRNLTFKHLIPFPD